MLFRIESPQIHFSFDLDPSEKVRRLKLLDPPSNLKSGSIPDCEYIEYVITFGFYYLDRQVPHKLTKWTQQGVLQGLPAPVNLYNPPPIIPPPPQIPQVAPIELHDHIRKQNLRESPRLRAPSPLNLQKTPSPLSPRRQFRHVENALEATKEISKDRKYKQSKLR